MGNGKRKAQEFKTTLVKGHLNGNMTDVNHWTYPYLIQKGQFKQNHIFMGIVLQSIGHHKINVDISLL